MGMGGTLSIRLIIVACEDNHMVQRGRFHGSVYS